MKITNIEDISIEILNNMEKDRVYSRKLMQYLWSKGFMLLNVKTCKEDPTKMIYMFYDNKKLRDAINTYETEQNNKQ